jgi:hypothetical protein
MATKDEFPLPFKNSFITDTSNSQYCNVNLNKNIQFSSNAFSEISKNFTTKKGKVLNSGAAVFLTETILVNILNN